MAKEFSVRIGTFEPIRVDVVQASVGVPIRFLFEDYELPGSTSGMTFTVWVRRPDGVAKTYSSNPDASGRVAVVPLGDQSGVSWIPDTEAFPYAGSYRVVLNIYSTEEISGTSNLFAKSLYTFPMLFVAHANPAYTTFSVRFLPQKLAAGAQLAGPELGDAGFGIAVTTEELGTIDITANSDALTLSNGVTISAPDGAVIVHNPGSAEADVPQIDVKTVAEALPEGQAKPTHYVIGG